MDIRVQQLLIVNITHVTELCIDIIYVCIRTYNIAVSGDHVNIVG